MRSLKSRSPSTPTFGTSCSMSCSAVVFTSSAIILEPEVAMRACHGVAVRSQRNPITLRASLSINEDACTSWATQYVRDSFTCPLCLLSLQLCNPWDFSASFNWRYCYMTRRKSTIRMICHQQVDRQSDEIVATKSYCHSRKSLTCLTIRNIEGNHFVLKQTTNP